MQSITINEAIGQAVEAYDSQQSFQCLACGPGHNQSGRKDNRHRQHIGKLGQHVPGQDVQRIQQTLFPKLLHDSLPGLTCPFARSRELLGNRRLWRPSRGQIRFIFLKRVAQHFNSSFCLGRRQPLRIQHKGCRPSQVQRRKCLQQMIPWHHAIMVGDSRIIDDPGPERVRNSKFLQRASPEWLQAVERFRSQDLLPDRSQVT